MSPSGPAPTEAESPVAVARVGADVAAVLLLVALAAAMSVDVVRAGFSIKSDEATYVTMAVCQRGARAGRSENGGFR